MARFRTIVSSHERRLPRDGIEALDLLPRRHECIVHQVLRQLPIRHDAHGNRHRDRRIAVVQQAERLAVTGPESFRQELVVGCVH